jgi:hypothetical protein
MSRESPAEAATCPNPLNAKPPDGRGLPVLKSTVSESFPAEPLIVSDVTSSRPAVQIAMPPEVSVS